ncbi:MAG: hypothetical protein DRJ49_07390 [Thermoprotei archaeon]|nr:MAG: hypothetical protein DRJ49_07390 [Thermoprotei archaeon]
MYSLDRLDYEILNKIQENPFNIAKIAKELKTPYHKVRRRLNRLLREERIARVYAEPTYPKLGLSTVVFVLNRRSENDIDIALLYSRIKARLLGNKTMLVYSIPKKFIRYLKRFIRILYGEDSIVHYGVYDKILIGKKDFKILDEDPDEIDLYRIDISDVNLYYQEHVEPLDCTDLFIIKKLQKDATTSITSIARSLGISKQLTEYHLRKHVMSRGLVEFNAKIFADLKRQPRLVLLVEFSDYLALVSTMMHIVKIPFTSSIFLSNNKMIMYIGTPINLTLRLMRILDDLVEKGVITKYEYYIQDPSYIPRRYTISCIAYRNGAWRRDRVLKALRRGEVRLMEELNVLSEHHRYDDLDSSQNGII